MRPYHPISITDDVLENMDFVSVYVYHVRVFKVSRRKFVETFVAGNGSLSCGINSWYYL